jgi:hypothetical protein
MRPRIIRAVDLYVAYPRHNVKHLFQKERPACLIQVIIPPPPLNRNTEKSDEIKRLNNFKHAKQRWADHVEAGYPE